MSAPRRNKESPALLIEMACPRMIYIFALSCKMWFKHWHIWKHTSLLATSPALEIKKHLLLHYLFPRYQVRSKTAKLGRHFSQGHSRPASNGTATNPPSFFKQHGLGILPSTVHQHLMKITNLPTSDFGPCQGFLSLLSDGQPFPPSHTTTGNR